MLPEVDQKIIIIHEISPGRINEHEATVRKVTKTGFRVKTETGIFEREFFKDNGFVRGYSIWEWNTLSWRLGDGKVNREVPNKKSAKRIKRKVHKVCVS